MAPAYERLVLVRRALSALCHDVGREGMESIRSIFMEATSQNITAIRAAVANADFKKLIAEAHKLKGACGILNLYSIEQRAVMLEQYATQNNFAQTSILCGEIEVLYHELVDAFKSGALEAA